MKTIEITMEKTCRVAKSFEVPDSIYEEIIRTGRIPDDYFNVMEKECNEETEVEYDYRVEDEDNGTLIVDWV